MDVVQLSGPVMFSGVGRCQIKLEAVDLVVCGEKTMEPRVGVEPTTCRLRIDCSTTELPRPFSYKSFYHRLLFLLTGWRTSDLVHNWCIFRKFRAL